MQIRRSDSNGRFFCYYLLGTTSFCTIYYFFCSEKEFSNNE